ncbi:MAG: peptidoglycan DD-metalloendopeptidase family protein [Candidatus Aenigmarchaeota archaeon]|nr:peptidoglycan DD-metalloendopeptidase family protein [Candidatus Aenigmarchaeota archaeon]
MIKKQTLLLSVSILFLILLSQNVLATADCFVYPIGTKTKYTEAIDGDGWYVPYGGRFRINNHLGEDWNLESGGISDCGQKVKSAADGKVVYSGDGGGEWGNVIIIRHTLPSGSKVETMYAHLLKRYVSYGKTVSRGQVIGLIGDGSLDGNCKDYKPWTAHLHFEVRYPNCKYNGKSCWGKPGPGYDSYAIGWTDPSNFIDKRLKCPTTPPLTTIVIDDGSSKFLRYGPSSYWHRVTGIGYGNDMYWTWNNYNKVENYVIWKPGLPLGGYYKVYAFIPRNYAYTKKAKYYIRHYFGTNTKLIDQSIYYDKWVYLGKYYFGANQGYVKLTDRTYERAITKKIGFDAMKFVKV